MLPNGRRLAWAIVVGVLLVIVGAVGFGLGAAAAHGGFASGVPVRGMSFRYPGLGLLGLVGPLILIGLAVTFIVLLLREPARPTPPPAPHDGTDGVDRLRELVTMHEQGKLTDEEFAGAKRKLLGL
jgi:hypothetical protein